MTAFAEKYPPGEAHEPMSIEAIYEVVYTQAKPKIEQAIAEKEAELEALLDGFAGLSPKLKDRANKRGEALQKEIHDLQHDQQDLQIPWERLRAELAARQDALERATATLDQEGHFRQKAEALKTVIGRIVCRFSRRGIHSSLKSIDIYAPEVVAVRPLGFPVISPHWGSCPHAKRGNENGAGSLLKSGMRLLIRPYCFRRATPGGYLLSHVAGAVGKSIEGVPVSFRKALSVPRTKTA